MTIVNTRLSSYESGYGDGELWESAEMRCPNCDDCLSLSSGCGDQKCRCGLNWTFDSSGATGVSDDHKSDRELLSETLEYLEDVQDEGPVGEGWKSEKLKELIKAITDRLNGD